MIFYDYTNFGVLNESTGELSLVSVAKVTNIMLSEMPPDFYTKPTLRWQISYPRKAKLKADLSYLTSGIEWRATYNVLLNKDDFTLNSWVTINNRSGKDFQNVNLKLIAGDVYTYKTKHYTPKTEIFFDTVLDSYDDSSFEPPEFEEREFSDFRLYTLDTPADIDNNQEKQLVLYPIKTVEYIWRYEYTESVEEVYEYLEFKNSTTTGLGIPLPAGNVNIYEVDERDNTNQFIGMSSLKNTSLDQDVSLKIGTASDIVAESKTLNSIYDSSYFEHVCEITISNQKVIEIEVDIVLDFLFNSDLEVLSPNIDFIEKIDTTYILKIRLAPGKTEKLTYIQRYSMLED